jgi:hypothetical protein
MTRTGEFHGGEYVVIIELVMGVSVLESRETELDLLKHCGASVVVTLV